MRQPLTLTKKHTGSKPSLCATGKGFTSEGPRMNCGDDPFNSPPKGWVIARPWGIQCMQVNRAKMDVRRKAAPSAKSNLPRGKPSRSWCACLVEQHDVAFQQRNGAVPCIEGLAQVLDELTGDLGLGLTQRDALQQSLHSNAILLPESLPRLAIPRWRLCTIATTKKGQPIIFTTHPGPWSKHSSPTSHLPHTAFQLGHFCPISPGCATHVYHQSIGVGHRLPNLTHQARVKHAVHTPEHIDRASRDPWLLMLLI